MRHPLPPIARLLDDGRSVSVRPVLPVVAASAVDFVVGHRFPALALFDDSDVDVIHPR